MKRLILIAIATIAFAAVSAAQPKAIGGRGGYGLELSYEHFIGGSSSFAELNLGIFGFTHLGFRATGTYNIVFAEPDITTRGEWAVYGGPGLSLGMSDEHPSNFFVGFVAQAGIEYSFWFPLQLSADLRPIIGVCDGSFYGRGFGQGFIPTISARYLF